MAAATWTVGGTGRAPLRALAAGLVTLALAGCGAGGGGGDVGPLGMGNSDGQGWFGSQMQTTTVATNSTGGDANAGAPGAPGTFDPTDYGCPPIHVRSGASSWQVTDKADGGLRYQATIGQTARECRFARPDTTIRIGIQGRVLVGAKGGPGSLTVPMRVAIVQEGPTPQTIWTKLYTVPVSIGANEMQVDFSLVVDDATVPLPTPKAFERYVIYIGFDPQAGTASAAAKPTKPKPASPKPVAARPAPAAAQAPKPASSQPKPQPTQAAQPAPAQQEPQSEPPAAAIPAPAEGWIGSPAPATGTFSQ